MSTSQEFDRLLSSQGKDDGAAQRRRGVESQALRGLQGTALTFPQGWKTGSLEGSVTFPLTHPALVTLPWASPSFSRRAAG